MNLHPGYIAIIAFAVLEFIRTRDWSFFDEQAPYLNPRYGAQRSTLWTGKQSCEATLRNYRKAMEGK